MITDPGARALADYTFASRYANYRPEDQRREVWGEANDRVFGMHRRFYFGDDELSRAEPVRDELYVQERLAEAEIAQREREILGSQRCLQFGGVPMLRKHVRGYNCAFSYADRPRFFAESLWVLLCGAGVGFSVQRHHVARLPKIWRPHGRPVKHTIADSIEGWADAGDALLMSYFSNTAPIEFDYSQIRDLGAIISTGVGRAPGPEPLRKALENVRRLLDRCLDTGAHRLRPIDVYDIVMFLSQAVLAGGVRRSATICLFSPDDEEMLRAKTGNWFDENPQRSRSNNSVVLVRGTTSAADFERLYRFTKEFGEPGFLWVDSTEIGVNPCVEVSFYPVDVIDGASGWQFCNLSLINASTVQSADELIRRARLAAVLGTLQAGYTTFDYLGLTSERITRRESLIGVSITGVQDCPRFALDRDVLAAAAAAVIDENERMADALGIPPAARTTCLKPEGTSSCMLGTASGVHKHHGRRYVRRVQASATEAPALAYAAANPTAVEETKRIGDDGLADVIVSFAIEAPEGSRVEDGDPIAMLDDVRLIKESWVDTGRVASRCTHPATSNNVSNTIRVREDQWDDVREHIFEHREAFAGVSLLGDIGDLAYKQAPFLSTEGEGDRTAAVAEWERLRETATPVDYSTIVELTDGTSFVAEAACAGGSCLV